ncbi:MAG: helix-turn-helix domain-containing protein [Actinomycetota bacterium]|nr:helix-turn-helix domain-containing protein [Actinomycetota bacterium]
MYDTHEHNHDHDHELLTISEAADVLRAPLATLRYWRHLGTGPRSFRLGRRVVYRRGDIEAWIDLNRDIADRGPAA